VLVEESSPARIVVAEAPDAVTAAIWVDALRDAGINAATFSRGHGAALGGAEAFATHVVLVDSENFAAARTVIAELGGASKLAPIPDHKVEAQRQRGALIAVGSIVAVILAAAVLGRLLTG
jgi:hypothetical protein